jgi:hypothetical protein
MNETNPKELTKAIEIFKEKYGDKEPLNMFELDEIIIQLRKEKK